MSISLSSWTIYLNNRRQSHDGDFRNSLNNVGSLGTYQGFECTWRQSVEPVFNGGTVRVFRDDITPMWEHPQNKGGGTMLANVSEPGKHSFRTFLLVMRGLIDGKLNQAEVVTGVVVSFRPWGYTMSIWLREGIEPTMREFLAESVRQLAHDDTLQFQFRLHEEHQAALEKRRSIDRISVDRRHSIDVERVERQFSTESERPGRHSADHDRFGSKLRPEQRRSLSKPTAQGMPRLETEEYLKSKRTVIQPEDFHLEGAEFTTTKVRGRRIAPPKYTLAQLESRWAKEFEIEQQRQAWTFKEGLWAFGMFSISAFVVSQLSTAAF